MSFAEQKPQLEDSQPKGNASGSNETEGHARRQDADEGQCGRGVDYNARGRVLIFDWMHDAMVWERPWRQSVRMNECHAQECRYCVVRDALLWVLSCGA